MAQNSVSVKSRDLQWFSLVVLLVVIARAALFFGIVPYSPQVQDRDHYWQIAQNLLDGKGFSRGGVPTNLRPPMTPFFFAGVIWLFGDHTLTIALSNWIVDAITCILLYLIASEIFAERRVAWISAVLFALYVPEMYYSWQAISEPLFGLSLAAFVLSFLVAIRAPSIARFATAGTLLGVASLTRSIMLYYVPLATVVLIWLLAIQGRRSVKWGTVFVFSFVIAMIPWTVHKYLTFGEFVPGDSNLGRTLYHGNYTLGEPSFLRYNTSEEGSASLKKRLHARIGFDYKYLPEPEFDRMAKEEAIKVIQEHPWRYLLLSIVRFFRTWYLIEGPRSSLGYLVLVFHAVLLALGAIALLCYRGTWLRPSVILTTMILFINLGALIRANVRYIVPIVPYVMMFSSVSIANIIRPIGHNQQGPNK